MTSSPNEESSEDDAWREIVENFGSHPNFPPVSAPEPPAPAAVSSDAWLDEDDAEYVPDLDDDHEPIPVPRRLAWIAALGAPAAFIAIIIMTTGTSIWIPHWVPALLVLVFLVGFGYLVATMPHGPDDPFDDGARL